MSLRVLRACARFEAGSWLRGAGGGGASGGRAGGVVFPARGRGAELTRNAMTGQRVLLTLGDHLGSTSTVIDRETGELVESVTYTAYGCRWSDVRPDRHKGLREDDRFTVNEDDVEVGLTAFAKRDYASALGRWASPDPLAVHAPGEVDLILSAYPHEHVCASFGRNRLTLSNAVVAPFEWPR